MRCDAESLSAIARAKPAGLEKILDEQFVPEQRTEQRHKAERKLKGAIGSRAQPARSDERWENPVTRRGRNLPRGREAFRRHRAVGLRAGLEHTERFPQDRHGVRALSGRGLGEHFSVGMNEGESTRLSSVIPLRWLW